MPVRVLVSVYQKSAFIRLTTLILLKEEIIILTEKRKLLACS